ncbi:MAG: tetratricopeptide repeat protein [Candidatus Latescibacteria bacterium]|nr:tetratricopeptide repeat protein [Candidatus Latescibacterota bacterium]
MLALLALGLLVAVPYLPAMLWGGFVWDDNTYVKVDPVRDVSGLWQIWFSPSALEEEGHYWPITYTTFWVEHKLWGFAPAGYHIVNVLLHLANTLLLWHLMRRLTVPGAWMVAAVFAVHPLHVESVAWIIERKDVLSGPWMRFVEKPNPRWYACSLVLYATGLLSKSIVVTLPVALLIWHWWKQGRVTSTDLWRLVPFFVVGLVVTVGDLSFYRSETTTSFDYSLAERALIAARALWFYAGKLLWPTNLAVIYPRWDIRVAEPLAWGYLVGAVALAVALWRFEPQLGRGPLAGTLFFVITLSPTLGFVDYNYMSYAFVADRYQYLAGIGVIAIIIGASAYGIGRLSGLWQKGALGGAVVVLILLGLLTWWQASIYRDDETFNRHIIALNPQARNAHYNLGKALYEQGRYEEAADAYRVAAKQRPNYAKVHANLGIVLNELGRFEEAATHLRRAIALAPKTKHRYYHLGNALYGQGRYAEAVDAYRVAVEQIPDSFEVHSNLGMALNKLGRFEEAETHLRRAIALDPQDVDLSQKLAAKLAEVLTPQGRYAEAIDVLAQAVALNPASSQTGELHFLMGMAAEENGQPETAGYYMRAFELDPHHTKAIRRLAHLRLEQQHYDEALELFQRLIDINPSDAIARGNMGIVLFYLGRSDEALQSFDQALSLDPTLESVRANREAVLEIMEGN